MSADLDQQEAPAIEEEVRAPDAPSDDSAEAISDESFAPTTEMSEEAAAPEPAPQAEVAAPDEAVADEVVADEVVADAGTTGIDLASAGADADEGAGGALAMALRESGLFGPAADTEEGAAEEEVTAGAAEEPVADTTADTTAEPAATEESTPEEEQPAEEVAEEKEPEPPAPVKQESPYELPGDWYVIHSYSGYENKVKANLETRISTMHMDSAIFDVVIPMEDVVEIKGGKKVTVPKKVLPGYLLVRMYMDDDAWFTVRNTPGVTGFVGSGTKPSPLTRREVERFLGVPEEEGEETKAAPRFKPAWDVGENVRVVEGPFADFNGVIEDINLDQSKVRVLVNIFDRETPVELTFEQIVKI